MTQFRDLEGVKGNGKLDAFMVDWHFIQPDPDNDLRDLTTPENRAHIERLKDSISVVGVKDAMIVRRDDADNIFATDGRCRLVALAELEAESRSFPSKVKTLPEERGTDRKKRMLNMLTVGRDRKNLSDFEFAQGLYRSIELGYSEKEVCDEMGWATLTTLHNHLDTLTLKPKLKEMVGNGKIARTEALRLQKMSPEIDPGQLLQDQEEEQRRLGKKGPVKLRTRHVKAAIAKAKPKPAQQEPTSKPQLTEAEQHARAQALAIARQHEQDEYLAGIQQRADLREAPAPQTIPDTGPKPAEIYNALDTLTEIATRVLNRDPEGNAGLWGADFPTAIALAQKIRDRVNGVANNV